ncbi:MAG TPA: DegQ family serine endoprotease [Candidatus Limnocylindrales bacterium]|nr:DegQ family serine endoprotease [Candidatus Limnocylindrales bacterium]
MKFPNRLLPAVRPRLRGLVAVALGGLVGSLATLDILSTTPLGHGGLLSASQLLMPRDAEAHYPSVDLAEIAERATASVVNISSTKVIKGMGDDDDGPGGGSPFSDDPFFRRFFQMPPGQAIPQERRAQSLGSGVIVTSDGVILTNNHVVENADEIKVTLDDNREFDAELIGADPQSDVAVVRLKKSPSGLKPLPIGDSSTLRLADTVLAIGDPFGVGQTVTMGIVSATGRANLGIADYEDFIQTDAAINPGNSGGALINLRGELVGINTAIASRTGGYQGIGFAIPSNMAKGIMTSLLETGKVERGWLGVSIQTLDRDLADAMGIDQAHGVLVADVSPDGPAKKAGIQRGDVILAIDGHDVKSTGELRNIVASHPSGKSVTVTLVRDKTKRELDVELGSLPVTGKRPGAKPEKVTSTGLLGGIDVSDLNAESRRHFGVSDKIDSGAVVTDVEPRSAAAKAGIGPGDVIVQIDQSPVKDAAAFRRVADKVKGNSALLLVARESGTMFVLVKK